MAHRLGEQHEMQRCEKEPEVVHALAQGELPPGLLQHAAACPVCSEVCSVSRQLESLLESSMEEPLEPAASVWWRLNLKLRRERMNRAQLPLVWMEWASAAVLLLTALFVLWQIAARGEVSNVLTMGLLGLATVALPVTIVLWRWSRS
jgi:hypothetical protein